MLECYDKKKLLDWRFVSKTVADEIVPRCWKTLIYKCPEDDDDIDEEDEKNAFYKKLLYASKVVISGINGSE